MGESGLKPNLYERTRSYACLEGLHEECQGTVVNTYGSHEGKLYAKMRTCGCPCHPSEVSP